MSSEYGHIALATEGIVARLRALVPGLEVSEFPENPQAFTIRHATGHLLLRYIGSTFRTEGLATSRRHASWQIYVITRKLHGAAGQIRSIELVQAALYRWRPAEGFGPLEIERDTHTGPTKSGWQHIITIGADATYVPLTLSTGDPQ